MKPASVNPNGIPSLSPGLRGTSYPGFGEERQANPERVVSRGVPATRNGCNPVGVGDHPPRPTQGRRGRANPGLKDAIPLGLAQEPHELLGNAQPGGEGRGEGEHFLKLNRSSTFRALLLAAALAGFPGVLQAQKQTNAPPAVGQAAIIVIEGTVEVFRDGWAAGRLPPCLRSR